MANHSEYKNYLVELLYKSICDQREHIIQQWFNPIGTSTKHFFIDDLLPEDICHKIYKAFPKDADNFHKRKSFREKKKTSANLEYYDTILADITYAIQDPKIVNLIASIVAYPKIEPDPLLYAGGLSMMHKGDFLNPHIDNSHDAKRNKYRRLNLLYYVSPDWSFENGGNLELWDNNVTKPHTIVSKYNRLTVMDTNKTSWHSVSPVKTDAARCCVSNYYFSAESPDKTEYFHVTSFMGRPEEKFKRAMGIFDNTLRNIISKVLKVGRGKQQVNKSNTVNQDKIKEVIK